jgi:hypothetical protein
MSRKIVVAIKPPAFTEVVEIPDNISSDKAAYQYAKDVSEERFADKLRGGEAFYLIYPKTIFTVMGDDEG